MVFAYFKIEMIIQMIAEGDTFYVDLKAIVVFKRCFT